MPQRKRFTITYVIACVLKLALLRAISHKIGSLPSGVGGLECDILSSLGLQVIVYCVLRAVNSKTHEASKKNKSFRWRCYCFFPAAIVIIIISKDLLLSEYIVYTQHPHGESSWVLLADIGKIVDAKAHAVIIDRLSLIRNYIFGLRIIISDAVIRTTAGKIIADVELCFQGHHKALEYKCCSMVRCK